MDAGSIGNIGTLLTALAALILSIESRLSDRPKLSVTFTDRPAAVFGSTDSRDFVPETMETRLMVFNAGRRPSVVKDVRCFVSTGQHRDELLNASILIYRTMRLPIPIPNDSAESIAPVWILGHAGPWQEYRGRFSLLPSSTWFELQVEFINGKVFSRRYAYHDLETIPFEIAQEYRDALGGTDDEGDTL